MSTATLIPSVMTDLAKQHAQALHNSTHTIDDVVKFIAEMKGEEGPLAAVYYFSALCSRIPAFRKDTITARIAIELMKPEPDWHAQLKELSQKHGVGFRENARAGCYDLYFADGGHAFAVSLRDACELIRFNCPEGATT